MTGKQHQTYLRKTDLFNGLKGQNQKSKTILGFNEARDDGIAVASAVPYANHLHLTDGHASTSSHLSYLQARCSS